jgi:hypothetical protein
MAAAAPPLCTWLVAAGSHADCGAEESRSHQHRQTQCLDGGSGASMFGPRRDRRPIGARRHSSARSGEMPSHPKSRICLLLLLLHHRTRIRVNFQSIGCIARGQGAGFIPFSASHCACTLVMIRGEGRLFLFCAKDLGAVVHVGFLVSLSGFTRLC